MGFTIKKSHKSRSAVPVVLGMYHCTWWAILVTWCSKTKFLRVPEGNDSASNKAAAEQWFVSPTTTSCKCEDLPWKIQTTSNNLQISAQAQVHRLQDVIPNAENCLQLQTQQPILQLQVQQGRMQEPMKSSNCVHSLITLFILSAAFGYRLYFLLEARLCQCCSAPCMWGQKIVICLEGSVKGQLLFIKSTMGV